MSVLLSPEDLRDDLVRDPGSWTVLDVRYRLGRTDGREEYERGHVPGAAFVDLDADLADPPGGGRGRHPLPDPERFAEAMRRSGVRADGPVVVYDDAGGAFAGRAWWLLRFHGHPEVRVLDGGWSWWVRVGGAVETGVAAPAYGDFRAGPSAVPVLDADGAAALGAAGRLVDARAAERFRGETEPLDPVAGHIPGARNVPHFRNLVADGDRAGRFKPTEQLAEEYAEVAGVAGEVGVYCGSGVTAVHDVIALELLGVRAALYPGSWSEWVSDPARPVATGPGD